MIQSTVMICRAQTKMSDLNVDRLLLTGGAVGLIYAYLARFLVMPLNAVDAGVLLSFFRVAISR